MYIIIYKNKKKSIISIALAIVISFGIILQGCTSELVFDDDILNSPELEEYIIAGVDYYRTLTVFEKELKKTDFSKLDVSKDTDGRIVMRLPLSSNALNFENKLKTLNEKKEKFLEKYPHFISFKEEKGKYFKHSIQKSVFIKGEFLKMGIDISRPMLKSGTEIWYGEDWYFLMQYMSSWVNNSNYVEMGFIAFSDGSYLTWTDGNNQTTTYWKIYTENGYHYHRDYPHLRIVWCAHTHRNSNTPSNDDNNFKNKYPNMQHNIYYNGCFYDY